MHNASITIFLDESVVLHDKLVVLSSRLFQFCLVLQRFTLALVCDVDRDKHKQGCDSNDEFMHVHSTGILLQCDYSGYQGK